MYPGITSPTSIDSLHLKRPHGGSFTAKLFRYPGKGGWHFAPVPDRLAPPVTSAWGRTPVMAAVDGYE